jgi:fatty acid desaturase
LKRGGRTYNFFAVYPPLAISDELIFSLLLLVILLYSTLQNPCQGLGNHDLSLVHDAISPTSALNDTAAVSASAVSGGVLRDWRWGHNSSVKGEPLHGWEYCSHLDSDYKK